MRQSLSGQSRKFGEGQVSAALRPLMRVGALALMIGISVLCVLLSVASGRSSGYDVVFSNGRLLDGTGNPWSYADVAISGDRIAAIGDLQASSAQRVIDVSGLYIVPGFIDTHTHAGPALEDPSLSQALPYLTQGVTTVLINPDGSGPTDLLLQRSQIENSRPGPNVMQMVPHGSVREQVLGMENRNASRDELEEMKRLVRTGMEAGAFGLSSGLFYAPGSFAPLDELVELAGVAAEFGGVYQSHVRDESDYTIGVAAAVDEVIEVARRARLPGIVTHIKILGPSLWGRSGDLIEKVESERLAGVELFADQYPYTASATGLASALIPRWAMAGGPSELQKRLLDPVSRGRIEAGILANLERRGGPHSIQFRSYPPDPGLEGSRLDEVARQRGVDPVQLVLNLTAESYTGIVSFNMSDEDVKNLMKPGWVMTASDGQLVPLGEGVPHPRSYGTFPRKICEYVQKQGTLDLPSAIRSMTSLPATVFRMKGRGQIRVGAYADLVVFDSEKVKDKSTYTQPHQFSEGMIHVMVNGQLVISDSKVSGLRPGKILQLGN